MNSGRVGEEGEKGRGWGGREGGRDDGRGKKGVERRGGERGDHEGGGAGGVGEMKCLRGSVTPCLRS